MQFLVSLKVVLTLARQERTEGATETAEPFRTDGLCGRLTFH